MEKARIEKFREMRQEMSEKPDGWRFQFALVRQKENKITDLLFGKKEDQITEVWKPCTANTAQIPPEETLVRKERRIEVVKAPKGSTGLADVLKEASRIKKFRLAEAIAHSYLNLTDIRFVTLVCLLIGFGIWGPSYQNRYFSPPNM